MQKLTISLESADLENLEKEAKDRRIPKSVLARHLIIKKLEEEK